MPGLKWLGRPVKGYTKTKGTNISYSSIVGWIDGAYEIGQRKDSSSKYQAISDHLQGLPASYIQKCDEVWLLDMAVEIIKTYRPVRGRRAGHYTTAILMNLNNRIAQIKRL